MPCCPAARPEAGALALRLALSFGAAITLAWLGAHPLAELLLPLTRGLLGWLDDRFAVLMLGLDHTHQDSVIRLRVNLVRPVVVGEQLIPPIAGGWLEATTPLGIMLQPLVVAVGLAGAWPGAVRECLLRFVFAAALGILFLAADLPLTLHAYVWAPFVQHADPGHVSPLLLLHDFLEGGGRLAMGVVMAVLAGWLAGRWGRLMQTA